jgi:hypothetical protein
MTKLNSKNIKKCKNSKISLTLVMTYLGYSFTMIWPYLGKLHGDYILPRLLQGTYGIKHQLQLLK